MGRTRAIAAVTAAFVVAVPTAFLAGKSTADDASSEAHAAPPSTSTSSTAPPVSTTSPAAVQPLTDGERYACQKYRDAEPLITDGFAYVSGMEEAAKAAEISDSPLFEHIGSVVRDGIDEVIEEDMPIGAIALPGMLFFQACARLGAPLSGS